MATSEVSFKFPRTRHIYDAGGDAVTRDDLLMTEKEATSFLRDVTVTVEEKVDGANVGISFDENYSAQVQNRSHVVNSSTHRQFSTLDTWLESNMSDLVRVLEPGYDILFGEWVYAKHSIHYTKLPSYFVAFDIYRGKEGRFLSARERNKVLSETNIACVRNIFTGKLTRDRLFELLNTQSVYYEGQVEGLYLRVDEDEQSSKGEEATTNSEQTTPFNVRRAKIVSSNFNQGIEEQWTKQKFTKNVLSYY